MENKNQNSPEDRINSQEAKKTTMLQDLQSESENKSNANENTANIETDTKQETEDNPIAFQSPVFRKKKVNKKLIIALVFGLLIVAVLVGLYLFGDKIFNRDNPQEILNSSLKKTSAVESFSFRGNTEMNFEGRLSDEDNSQKSFSLAMHFDGGFDESDSANAKSFFNFKPELAISQESGNENFSLDLSTMSFGKAGEGMIYFKLNNLDLGTMGIMYGGAIAPYKNKWYFIDTKEILEKAKKEKEFSLDEKNDFDFEKIEKEIRMVFGKYEIIKFQKDLGDVEINGKEVYHYQVKINSEELLDFYVEFLKVIADEVASVTGDDLMIDQDFDAEVEAIKKEISPILNEVLANVKTEIWIGKEDNLIYKIGLKGDYSAEDINRIAKRSLGTARAKAQDAAIKATVSSMVPDLIIYGDDNGGNFEGYSLDKNRFGATGSKINIRTNKNSYVIWAELATTTNKWCVDSNNNSGYVLGNIKGFECLNASKKPQGEKRDISEIESEGDEIDAKMSFQMTIEMFDFNQPINLSEPEEAEDLLKLLEEAIAGFMGGGTMASPTIHPYDLDSDFDGLSDAMEEIYGTDKNNPDTDGDGYLDGAEVENGYDPAIPGDAKLSDWKF